VRDALIVEKLEKPVVCVICDEFVVHGETLASVMGHPNLKILVFPYPVEGKPEAELRRIAEQYYPQMLKLLGAA
jgi:hypothetical protein